MNSRMGLRGQLWVSRFARGQKKFPPWAKRISPVDKTDSARPKFGIIRAWEKGGNMTADEIRSEIDFANYMAQGDAQYEYTLKTGAR